MKTEFDGPSPWAIALYRILLGIVAVLICVIVGGTIFAFATKKSEAKIGSADSAITTVDRGLPPPAPADGNGPDAVAYFTGIGKIRAMSAGTKAATIVVSVAFPYDRGDSAFAEELAAKTKTFREITKNLFSSLTAAELKGMAEDKIKDELKKRFNAELSLGKIKNLYFNDYLVID